MKIVNSITSLKQIIYKVYEDAVLISNDLRDRNIKTEGIELVINDWMTTLNNMNFKNKEIQKIVLALIDEIKLLRSKREVNIYVIWDIQNKIDCLKCLTI